MPTRLLRDGILDSEAVNSLDDSGEIFFRRLMSVVDDYGRFELNLDRIRSRCFPLALDRWPLPRVSKALTDVSKARTNDGQTLVAIYQVGGRTYLQINNFGQRTRTSSKCPPPNDGKMLTFDGQMTVICQPQTEAKAYAETEAKAGALSPARPHIVRTIPTFDAHGAFEEIYAVHATLEPGYKVDGMREWSAMMERAVNPEALSASIAKAHCEWVAHWRRNGGYVPGIERWLSEAWYLKEPKARDSPKSIESDPIARAKAAYLQRQQEGKQV